MSKTKSNNRVSIKFPPVEPGALKTQKNDKAITLAAFTIGGRIASSPSHPFYEHSKIQSQFSEQKTSAAANANIIK